MPYHEFIWTPHVIEKVSNHGLTVDEVEYVMLNARGVPMESRSSGRPMYTGYTRFGELLAVIFELIDDTSVLIITAYKIGREE
jgi:uncharacterized DUF497 family protein